MDDYFFFLQSLLLCVAAVALLQLAKVAATMRRRPRTPPGPWRLPVIGSMHHLVNALPHRALRDLAGVHGPLMMLGLGETPVVVASSRGAARAVLKTHDANFATRPVGNKHVMPTRPRLLAGEIVGYGWADILFSPSGDYWRKLRQLCAAEILSPKRVLSFRHIREDEVTARVEEIRAAAAPSTPVNLSVLFHSTTNDIVARAAFGRKRKSAPEFMAAIKAGVGLSSGFKIPDLFPTWTTALAAVTGMKRSLRGIHKTVDAILQEIIDERRCVRGDKINNGGAADDQNADENLVDDMFAGGTGTSASALEWAMSELMRNPAVMKKLQGQIREAFHRKAVVTEADLQASNLSYEFIPFGSGRRMCPGFNYGLASMELVLVAMLYHFDWSLLVGVKEVDMEEAPGLGVRRRSPLLLCATPFVPAAVSADY
uniref:Cytochrome P450 n=1 Tax=Oryza rufipogon TaxID=4529 RepID=A0A0E0P138_ORYRU